MSNKSRLQINNTNLQALISKANALPNAGSGSGGGSLETCTVTITLGSTAGNLGGIGYTSVQNNEIIACNKMLSDNSTVEITCLCGSVLVVNETFSRISHTYNNLTEIVNEVGMACLGALSAIRTFQVTAPANGSASLTIEVDSGI